MINFSIVGKVLGVLLIILGALMWTGLPFSFYYESGDVQALFLSGIITILTGLTLWRFRLRRSETFFKREGYLIVAFGWLSMAIFSTLPYLLSNTIPSLTDAFFESISGLTTTGASVITDIESVPKGILYWRSLTQWIGGMGIIVLTVALFPLLGIGGVELFVAEAPGPTSDKLHPRIRETAKRLWAIYVALTIILALILRFLGMSFYDAINHALTTMATGGFSTKNSSMVHYQDQPIIQYTIILFMFIAGTNYALTYFGLKGKFRKFWASDEFRAYAFLTIVLSLIAGFTIYQHTSLSLEQSFRDALFQVVSIITTTGFVSADYTSWTPSLTLLFFILMFVGASAGSTSGGIKIIRHLVFFKNSFLEFKRIIHPRAIVPLKINQQVVASRVMTRILVFLLLYLMLFLLGSLAMSSLGMDFMTAIGATATSLGNVGPGIGAVGPMDNFAEVVPAGKWLLAFLMLLGRLELFTILVLFTPYFWKSN